MNVYADMIDETVEFVYLCPSDRRALQRKDWLIDFMEKKSLEEKWIVMQVGTIDPQTGLITPCQPRTIG